MTARLLAGCGGAAVLAVLWGRPRLRSPRAAAIALAAAGGWPIVLMFGPWGHAGLSPARLSTGLGTLALSRVGAGLLALTAVAGALRHLSRRDAQGPRSAPIVAVLVAPIAVLALSARGLVPLALLLTLLPLAVAVRWGRVAGPGTLRAGAVRSGAITGVGLLAGVALASTVGLGRTAPPVVGICLALALAAAVGLVPFTPWGVLASGLPGADADLALTWCIPVGVLGSAILLAGLPGEAAAPLQVLLLGLGLATAVVWAAIAAAGSDPVRAAAVQAADVGLMVAGLSTGRLDGLLGTLLLLVVTLLVPATLTARAPAAVRVAGWLAAGGLPPLGAFPARLLILAAVSTVAFTPTALVTLAMGGLLLAGVRGALRGLRTPPEGGEEASSSAHRLAGVSRWLVAAAALGAGPLGPLVIPLVYGVHW
ncbi:MAG TPA: hypothetical protein VMW47_04775 [Verrucomicrobiae bacterium]|nr:hypothetical protein [Verrucomicrobiae bacterium]